MPHDPRKYLSEMLDRATFVSQFMADQSPDVLQTSRLIRSAVERELMVLGEALFQLHRAHLSIAKQIQSWDKIIGFRHVLVHGYDSLNLDIIWDVVHDELPSFIEQVNKLLAKETP